MLNNLGSALDARVAFGNMFKALINENYSVNVTERYKDITV